MTVGVAPEWLVSSVYLSVQPGDATGYDHGLMWRPHQKYDRDTSCIGMYTVSKVYDRIGIIMLIQVPYSKYR